MTNASPLQEAPVQQDEKDGLDIGKQRSLQRAVSEDGLFHVLAIDHLSDFAELLSPDPSTVTFADVVRAKDTVIRTAGDSVSAVLLDSLYGGHLIHAGTISRSTGLMFSLEDEDYSIPPGPRRTRMREGWTIEQAKLAGVDVAKLLWFFRPDADTADDQLKLLQSLVEASADLSLPLLVEPIWYPLPGEDATTDEWKADRVRGIIESAVTADQCGVDVLKVEFPGYVDTPDGRAASVDAVAELDERTTAPWVVLSAGVGYEDFASQIEIASAAGSSGYVAGRSIWRDALLTHDPAKRDEAIAEIKHRFDHLNELTRQGGRPVEKHQPLDDVLGDLPEDWYHSWHAPAP
jgi:tagatose 1,6-diphosphate aldolase